MFRVLVFSCFFYVFFDMGVCFLRFENFSHATHNVTIVVIFLWPGVLGPSVGEGRFVIVPPPSASSSQKMSVQIDMLFFFFFVTFLCSGPTNPKAYCVRENSTKKEDKRFPAQFVRENTTKMFGGRKGGVLMPGGPLEASCHFFGRGGGPFKKNTTGPSAHAFGITFFCPKPWDINPDS